MSNVDLKQEKILVALLCGVQIAHILDFVIIMPLGPVLMRAFDLVPSQFGLLVSSYHLSAGIAGLFLGAFANKFDKKSLLLTLFTLFIGATFLCSTADSYNFFLFTRILAGVFGGLINSLIFTIVSEVIPFQRRGKAMGSIISSFSIASVAGIPIGLTFSDLYSWRASFYFIVGFSFLLMAFLTYYFPKMPALKLKNSIKTELTILVNCLIKKDYLPSYLLIGAIAFSGFMLFPYLSAFAVHNMGIAESEVKYIYLSGGFFTIIASRLIGRQTDKKGALKVFIPFVLSTFPVIVAYTTLENISLPIVLVIATLFMVLMAGRIIPAMTLISEVPKDQDRGSFMSAMNSFRTFISAIATYVAGLILVESGSGKLENFNYIGYLAIIISLVAILLAMSINKRIER